MSRRTRKTFPQEFKQQIANLYLAGRPHIETTREYELTASAFDKWVKQFKTSGSFKEKDNLTPERKGLLELRKRDQQLEIENDILKQAALILGQRDKQLIRISIFTLYQRCVEY